MTSSQGAVSAAVSGRGLSDVEGSADYKIILPPLPNGYIAKNSVFLHCDVRNRPYRIQDFREELLRLKVLPELASAGAHQMNHVWMLRMHTLAAKQRLLDAKELRVKGGRCLVLDPANTEVKLRLHWVPYDVSSCQVRRELERYGKVSDVSREHFRERGFEGVETNTRVVQMTLRDGVTVDDIPHEIRLEGCKVLVLVPGRAPLCLRCRRKGHIRRDCHVPRCTECHRFGHESADCVRTYATMAQERVDNDTSDLQMDEAEAEDAAGGITPPTADPKDTSPDVRPATQVEASTRVQRLPLASTAESGRNAASTTQSSSRTTQSPVTSGANAGDDQQPQEDDSRTTEAMDAEAILAGKRQLDDALAETAPEDEGGGELPWHHMGPKKHRRAPPKPRIPADGRQRKDSL